MNYLLYLLLGLGAINVTRLFIMMVGADLYEIYSARRHRTVQEEFTAAYEEKKQQKFRPINYKNIPYQPYITVVIPAYNEEVCIIATIRSVLASDYSRLRVVVVDDGSTDKTFQLLESFKIKFGVHKLTIVHQTNTGKAAAINNAVRNHARSSLIMVLDADSLLHPQAISQMVEYFKDPEIVAAAANVKVLPGSNVWNLAQRLEYVISYRMKRALTTFNMEYIIGGVGSTFRKSIIQQCGYYDTDTMTEDIDFTMKIINQRGNRHHRIVFAANVLAYTEAVTTLGGLLKQRFRWKYGRMQTFVKNKTVFFSKDKERTKRLTWAYLPFIIFSELELLFDPILTGIVLGLAVMYGGLHGLLTTYLFVTLFSLLNILSEHTESWKDRLHLTAITLFAYPLLMLMSLIDYLVLIKSLWKFPDIIKQRDQVSHWTHVERSGAARFHNRHA